MYKVKRMASKDWDLLSQRSAVGNVLNILHSLSHNLIGTVCTSDLSNRLSSLSNALKWREMQLTVQKNHLESPAVWAIIKLSTTNIMQFFFFSSQRKQWTKQSQSNTSVFLLTYYLPSPGLELFPLMNISLMIINVYGQKQYFKNLRDICLM